MPASSSNFGTLVKLQCYPRNIQYIPVVEIFAFLELKPRLNIKKDLTWQVKIIIF